MSQLLVPRSLARSPAETSSPVRVLHVINGEHFSGAERVQDLLGMCLPRFGVAPAFACLKPGRFPNQRQSRDCPLHLVPMRGKFDRRSLSDLCRIVAEQQYQILHAHTPRSLLVASRVARRLKLPLVYHVHSPVGRDSTRSWSNWINQRVESWAARRVNHFVCVSESLRQYMTRLGHDPERITTVANGVAVVPNVAGRATPRPTWTLGTTALFRPRKGMEVLLQGLLAMKKRMGLDVRLLAVGPFESPEYEQQIKNLADELSVADCIEWTGFTSDVNSYFQRMDLFVLPSLFGEGLPMVILEAMANGVPVVAANVEGIPQAIRDRQDGLIFEPGNADDLARQVQHYVAGDVDWQTLRQSALERQRTRFSDESMADGVAGVYRRVLATATSTT